MLPDEYALSRHIALGYLRRQLLLRALERLLPLARDARPRVPRRSRRLPARRLMVPAGGEQIEHMGSDRILA